MNTGMMRNITLKILKNMNPFKSKNRVFKIELCREDAERVIIALEIYKDQCQQKINSYNDENQKESAWLDYSYASELLYMFEDIFDLNNF